MSNTNDNALPIKGLIKIVAVVLVLFTGLVCFFECKGYNNDQDWQIVQSVGGKISVVSAGGYYNKAFGTVWTYPKYMHFNYTQEATADYPNDESIEVVFNDGGTAKISTVMRIQTPTNDDQRRAFHRQFGGDLKAVRNSVKAHLSNTLRSTAPLMSSSEYQTARKSEYSQLVEQQLNQGLFEMRRVEKVLKDTFDSTGKPIAVFATEIILNDKALPTVAQPSPLQQYGVFVGQFSVTHEEPDAKTKEQFAVKKDAFLAAENSKAQREKEVQQRLMVEEKGRREKAEIEAESNKLLAAATIKANQEKLVAETLANQEKNVAETNASKLVAVALQTKAAAMTAAEQAKSVAETNAAQELTVAQLQRQAAEENAKKQITLAEAQKTSLALGGALSERERVLAQIAADRDVRVAAELSKIQVPSTIVNGGSGASGGDLTSNLMNIRLLEASGLIHGVSQAK